MSLTVYIDDTEAGTGGDLYIEDGSVQVRSLYGRRDQCSFTVLRKDTTLPLLQGMPVEVRDESDDLRFGGSIIETQIEDKAVTGSLDDDVRQRIEVECVDHNEIADRRLVSEVYEDMIFVDVVTDLHATYLAAEGITLGTIDEGPTVARAVFDLDRVSDALDVLKKQSGYVWNIDYEKELTFRKPGSVEAPSPIVHPFPGVSHISVHASASDVRTRQYVRGGQALTDERTETFAGDGERQAFLLKFDCAKKPTVRVNSVKKTVGITGVDEDKDWYWNKGKSTIAQDDGASPLAEADTLAVDYQGFYPILLQAEDADAIANRKAIAGGGTGLYEHVEEYPALEDLDSVERVAKSLLDAFSDDTQTVTVITETAGYRAGQVCTIIDERQQIEGVFFLRGVDTEEDEAERVRVVIEAVSNDRIGDWTDFWRQVTDRRAGPVLHRENEVLTLSRPLSSGVLVSSNLTTTEQAPVPMTTAEIGSSNETETGFTEVLA